MLLSLKMSLMVVSVAGAVVMRDPLTRMQPCAAAHYCSAAAIFGPRARLDSPAQFVAVEWQGRLGNNIGQYVVARYWAEQLGVPLLYPATSQAGAKPHLQVLDVLGLHDAAGHVLRGNDVQYLGDAAQAVFNAVTPSLPALGAPSSRLPDPFSAPPAWLEPECTVPGGTTRAAMDAAGISSATPRCGVTCSCWEPPSVACARPRNFTLQASARYTGAHIGGLKHGALGIAFRGYFHANPALLRLGDDFLRAVASWRRTSPEPPPWLSPSDVVLHLRSCAPPDQLYLQKVRRDLAATTGNPRAATVGHFLRLPTSFYDKLLGDQLRHGAMRRLWVVVGGEYGCANAENPLLRHLQTRWNATRAPTSADATSALSDQHLMATASRVIVPEGSSFAAWPLLINRELTELHVPLLLPTSTRTLTHMPLYLAKSASGRQVVVVVHVPMLSLWGGTPQKSDTACTAWDWSEWAPAAASRPVRAARQLGAGARRAVPGAAVRLPGGPQAPILQAWTTVPCLPSTRSWAWKEDHSCDPNMARMLTHARNVEGLILDVGAHGGRQTRTALRFGRRVLAIDCLEEAYADNLKLLGSEPNVTLLKVCAGGSVKMASLHLAGDSSSLFESMVAEGAEATKAKAHRRAAGRTKEDVVVVPLDMLIREPVAGIKIDVQGNEPAVFEGMQRILAEHRPSIMYEEAAGGTQALEMKYLKPLGYRCGVHSLPIGTDKVCFIPNRHAPAEGVAAAAAASN